MVEVDAVVLMDVVKDDCVLDLAVVELEGIAPDCVLEADFVAKVVLEID